MYVVGMISVWEQYFLFKFCNIYSCFCNLGDFSIYNYINGFGKVLLSGFVSTDNYISYTFRSHEGIEITCTYTYTYVCIYIRSKIFVPVCVGRLAQRQTLGSNKPVWSIFSFIFSKEGRTYDIHIYMHINICTECMTH